MSVLQIFLSGILATSLMTLFSYLVASAVSGKFREPRLLNVLMCQSTIIPLKPGKHSVAGWLVHYGIGWLFVVIFDFIWQATIFEPSLLTGAALGFIFGFIGIAGWQVMFSLSRNPPEVSLGSFYLQLVFAHVIFGIGAVILYL